VTTTQATPPAGEDYRAANVAKAAADDPYLLPLIAAHNADCGDHACTPDHMRLHTAPLESAVRAAVDVAQRQFLEQMLRGYNYARDQRIDQVVAERDAARAEVERLRQPGSDVVEAWIKRKRDEYIERYIGSLPVCDPGYYVLDTLLDDYRLHVVCGTPLTEPTPTEGNDPDD
jgi:hypothetical protein